MYLSWKRKRALLIFGAFILIAVIFFTLWVLQPPQTVSHGKFRVLGTPTPMPSLASMPERTPIETPVVSTPTPRSSPILTKDENKRRILRLCSYSNDASYCALEVAKITKDHYFCENSAMRDECFSGLAKATKNIDYCNEISDLNKKFLCQVVIANTPGLCTSLSSNSDTISSSMCYEAVAVADNNAALCEKAEFPADCYYKVAIANKNEGLCDKSSYPIECKAVIDANSKLCEEAEAPAACYERFLELGLVSNEGICSKVAHTYDCYYELAKKTQNISYCVKARDIIKCKAVIERNKSLCAKAGNRRACYGDLAVALAKDEAGKKK